MELTNHLCRLIYKTNSFFRHDILIIEELFSQECVSGLSVVNCSHVQIFMLQLIEADKAQKKNVLNKVHCFPQIKPK